MSAVRLLTVNGQEHRVAVEPFETLLDVLREKIGLTGTKKACNVGDCGACTVLVDGEPMNSCLLLAATLEGRAITTIEGLAQYGNGGHRAIAAEGGCGPSGEGGCGPFVHLTPLQKAFVHEGAIQCGFCTPGMVLAASALLDKDPHPSLERIKESLSGNLCRCTGYSGIVRAVQRCANYRDDGTCGKRATERRSHEATEGREQGTGNGEQDRERSRDREIERSRAAPDAQSEIQNPKSKIAPQAAVGSMSAIDPSSTIHRPQFDSVGVSIPRVDAADKVTGRALYTADIKLPNMLHGKILGSSVAHGRIRRLDVSRAAALEGVVAVVTAADAPRTLHGVSPARYDEDVLCTDKVRHVGDPVAAVAAVDERTAERALGLIDVDYDELPAVLDPFEAVAEGAPLVHDRYPRNINTHVHQDFGDVEAGFAESHHVREETFVGNHIYQCPLEPHASVALWEHDGTLRIYTSTQVPHYVQYMLAHVFHIPLGRIRVIRPAVGGGFGGKAATTPLDLCAALLARKTGRPVKMVYSREEMFHYGRGRHKQHMRFKLGVDREGRIRAFKSEIHLDGGAYSSFGVATAYYAGSMMPTLYHIPNYRYDGYRVMTNKPACGAMRGHGVPQPRFAFECLLTMVAEDLGIDPIEIRRRNAMTANTLTVNQMDVASCEFLATLDAVADKSGWAEKYVAPGNGSHRGHREHREDWQKNDATDGEQPGEISASVSSVPSVAQAPHVRRGIGVGCGGFVSGAGYCIYRGQVQLSHEKPPEHFQKRSIFPHANAVVKVTEDGMAAVLMIGAADIGQGSDTVLVQMCAEAMGIPPSRIRIRSEDSDISPLDLGAYSSRITLMGGQAVSRAGAAVVEKMKPYAAKLLHCDPSQVVARDGWMYVRGSDGATKRRSDAGGGQSSALPTSVPWEEVARKYFNDNGPLVGTGCYKPPDGLGGDYKGATVGTSPAYSFGSAVCEVAVDLETGKVKVERFTDYHDCGTPVNPQAVHGQVEGAIVMSAGETLMEDVQFDSKGRLLNPNLHGYLMMTIKDAPEIFSGLVDSYEPRGPFGAKEIGEGSTLPVLGAVAHAVANATGVWIKDLPITPEKIRRALREQRPIELSAAH